MSFRGLAEDLADQWEVVPLELPGHGARSPEPLCEDMVVAAHDLSDRLMSVARSRRFFLMGHSMGGALAYEILRTLEKRGRQSASAMIVAATPPLTNGSRLAVNSEVSDEDFLRSVAELGGVAEELLENEISKYYAPVIRADLRMYGGYRVPLAPYKIACPLLVLLGGHDPLTKPGDSQIWRSFSRAGVATRLIAGAGHFFLDTHRQEAVAAIRAFLNATRLTGPGPNERQVPAQVSSCRMDNHLDSAAELGTDDSTAYREGSAGMFPIRAVRSDMATHSHGSNHSSHIALPQKAARHETVRLSLHGRR